MNQFKGLESNRCSSIDQESPKSVMQWFARKEYLRDREQNQEVERDQPIRESGHLQTNWEISGGPGPKWEVA